MSAPSKSPTDASHHDSLRKRVGKACDRCRLKKSKCDGSSPCSRCRIDNAICVFGERKKSHDKVYPKGYVEMLEQQQTQLVAGLQETYRRLIAANLWPGTPLDEHEGHPLTHDILTTLDIIHLKDDSSSDHFEEDTERLQSRLVAQGAPFIHRRGSFSSDSEHSTTHSHKRARSVIVDTPILSPVQKSFRTSFEHDTASASPLFPASASVPTKSRNAPKPSPLHTESPVADVTQPTEDDSLMTAWSWQDLPPEGISSQEPQFTFPQDDSSMLETWPNMAVQDQFDPTFMAAYPPGMNFNFDFSLGPQTSRDLLDYDMGNFVPVAS